MDITSGKGTVGFVSSCGGSGVQDLEIRITTDGTSNVVQSVLAADGNGLANFSIFGATKRAYERLDILQDFLFLKSLKIEVRSTGGTVNLQGYVTYGMVV